MKDKMKHLRFVLGAAALALAVPMAQAQPANPCSAKNPCAAKDGMKKDKKAKAPS